MYDLYKALFAELLGSFLLVFIGASAVALTVGSGGSTVGNSLAFGLSYMILIYILNGYSGSHLNPAVSFGFAITGRMGWCRMLLYWLAQILGAILAGLLVAWIYGFDSSFAPGGDLSFEQPWKVVVLEMILTFFLVLTFLSITRNASLSIMSGFIIGAVLIADVLVGGFLARIGVNPAYAIATGVLSGNWGNLWIYILGPLLGALLAALLYKGLSLPWSCHESNISPCGKTCNDQPFFEEWKTCAIEGDLMPKPARQFERECEPCVEPRYEPRRSNGRASKFIPL